MNHDIADTTTTILPDVEDDDMHERDTIPTPPPTPDDTPAAFPDHESLAPARLPTFDAVVPDPIPLRHEDRSEARDRLEARITVHAVAPRGIRSLRRQYNKSRDPKTGELLLDRAVSATGIVHSSDFKDAVSKMRRAVLPETASAALLEGAPVDTVKAVVTFARHRHNAYKRWRKAGSKGAPPKIEDSEAMALIRDVARTVPAEELAAFFAAGGMDEEAVK